MFVFFPGTYTLYDGIVLPRSPPSGIIEWVKGFFGFGSGGKEFLNHESLREKSFHIFLEEHKRNLINTEPTSNSKLNFTKYVSGIYDIYTQLHRQDIYHGDNQSREDYRLAPKLTKVIHLNIVLLICFNLVKIDFSGFHRLAFGYYIKTQVS